MPVVSARIALVLGLALASSRAEPSAPEKAPRRKPVAASAEAPAVPADEIIDLDFTDDFPARPSRHSRAERPVAKAATHAPGSRTAASAAVEARPVPVPAPVEAVPEASRAWKYWALGITTLAGVAGGAFWYLHEDDSRSAGPIRNRQVFTDAKE
jgi:hypothetical protein